MAIEEYVEILKRGAQAWNSWRKGQLLEKEETRIDLSGKYIGNLSLIKFDLEGVNLSHANLQGANLAAANLRGANLSGAKLSLASLMLADLRYADLTDADLTQAQLSDSNLTKSNLSLACLEQAGLRSTILSDVKLRGANLANASIADTAFLDVDLSEAKGLDQCVHAGPSTVDFKTLRKSNSVPLVFWRGCGLPDALIDYMPSLTGEAIQFYSCFISYSSKDQEFADRLHADLQNAGVRCWFAPHDLSIGTKILDGLDEAIRLRDKVVLILSEGAITSDWVEDEVATAFEEERRRKETMLFPIRLDDAVMDTSEAWASKLRARNIGDFTKWKDHDAYKAKFRRVLRDLKVEG